MGVLDVPVNASFFLSLCATGFMDGYFGDSEVPQEKWRIEPSESYVFQDLNSPLKSRVFALGIGHFSVVQMIVFPSRFVALECKVVSRFRLYIQTREVVLTLFQPPNYCSRLSMIWGRPFTLQLQRYLVIFKYSRGWCANLRRYHIWEICYVSMGGSRSFWDLLCDLERDAGCFQDSRCPK